MNILHLLSQNQLTGAEVYSADLIRQQIAASHVVFQVSNGFFAKNDAEQIQLDVETKSFFLFLKSVFQFRKILIQKNIQVIHAHSRAASKLAFYARIGLKIGFVSTVHGRQHVSVSKKINNIYGDFLVPVCENISDQLINEFKYNPRRIKMIENGIDLNKFKFQKIAQTTVQKISGKNEKIKIAIIGRDSGPKKIRTEIFVSEFSKILMEQKVDYDFYIIGGDRENYCIENKNIIYESKSVVLNSDYYHQFDLICGSGRVCIESILCGVPVIAFGEAQYLGLVTIDNYHQFKETNFGDIGQNFNNPKFNESQAQSDYKNFSLIDTEKLSIACSHDFDLNTIHRKIERIYQSSFFIRNYSKWIPILMYHKIPDIDLNGPHKIYVTKNNFEKHLKFFKFCGFTTLTFNELSLFRRGLKSFDEFPKKPLILTFDDGYSDNIVNADPLLKKYNFSAQIFLLADSKIESNTWDQWATGSEKHFLISGTDRHQWTTSNFEIGSHGSSHQKMPEMNFEQKLFELNDSKNKLQIEFKKSISVFAFTYGLTNTECAEACQKSGYEYGLNTDRGGLLIEENPYSVFRVNIFPNENLISLFKKTSKWYRKYYYLKRRA